MQVGVGARLHRSERVPVTDLVRTQASRDGAWYRIQLNQRPGNLLSIDLIRALGQALHDLESTRGIKWRRCCPKPIA